LCGSTAWTKTNAFNNAFTGIYLNTGAGTANNVQNNTIRNLNWSNSTTAGWTGIQIAAGDANIGTTTGNTIGAVTGTGSILLTNTINTSNVYGIYVTSTGTIDCRNNNIGSITLANAAVYGCNFYGIYKSNTAGTTTISNNLIGSQSTANSINATSASTGNTQTIRLIFNAGTGTIVISNNTVANINNGTTNVNTATRGRINGIYSSSASGTNTISGNLIHDLTIANANNLVTLNASVCGIALSGSTPKIVTGNTIYNLLNTYDSFTGGVIGLYFTGSTTGNTVSGNFIHSLSVSSSSTASIYGISMSTGSSTYANNIITLGGNTPATIYGIYEAGAAGTWDSLNFNTVYIDGAPTTGALSSYALYNSANTNTRNFLNNIFVNARSNSGATGNHYAIRLQGTTNLTIDYNDYYASGTGGVLGFLTSDRTTLADWRTATGQDAYSMSSDPLFLSAGGTNATDYIPSTSLPGVAGTGITTDFGGATRATPPTMGAWEGTYNMWKGTISNDWNTPGNWTAGTVPGPDANIEFDASPVNNCLLDQARSVDNIINSSSYQMVTGGNKLTIKGALIFSGGAQIDASAANSTVEFGGAVAQTIPAGSFYNDQVYNLLINNSYNVTLNGTLILLDSLKATAGLLDASTATPTIIYGGTSFQTIDSATFLNDRVYNLTSDNGAGVTLKTDFTVDNSLTINSGKILSISVPNLLNITGTIVNNAGNSGLVLKSDASGDAKLITDNSTSGTVELYLTGGLAAPNVGIFHYFVPPVQTMYIGSTTDEVKANLNVTNFGRSLLDYSEPDAILNKEDGWRYFNNYPDLGTPNFTSLTSDRGYNIYFWAYDTIVFKGQLNGVSHSFNLSYTSTNPNPGWNLVGNPYPCNYDLNGVDGLATIVPGISNTVYYNNNGGYTYWNVYTKTGSTVGYTDILPPMTGFFVHVSQTSMSLSLPASSKTAAASDPRSLHKGNSTGSVKSSDIRKVKLVLSSGSKTDETIVMLFDDASTSYNEHYDAFKLSDKISDDPAIYSQLNGVNYFMKALAVGDTQNMIIPLRVVIKEAGTHEIFITEFENLEGIKVTLKHGDTETRLSRYSSYTFTSNPGTYDNFELIFGDRKSTKGADVPASGDIRTWYRDNYLYVSSSGSTGSESASMVIYDLNGSMVYNLRDLSLIPDQTNQIPVPLQRGLYITDILINNIHHRLKFVVY
jgi:hypothetical protein